MIRPEDFEQFELYIINNYFKPRGFMLSKSGYHDIFPKEMVNALAKKYDPTSLYLRARTDRIATHPTLYESFQVEIKTHVTESQNDILFEVMPFIIHKLLYDNLGIRCLYIYSPTLLPILPYCLWIHEIINQSQLKSIDIPQRWANDTTRYEMFHRIIKAAFPGIEPRHPYVKGSGDPYIILTEKSITNWRKLEIELENILHPIQRE